MLLIENALIDTEDESVLMTEELTDSVHDSETDELNPGDPVLPDETVLPVTEEAVTDTPDLPPRSALLGESPLSNEQIFDRTLKLCYERDCKKHNITRVLCLFPGFVQNILAAIQNVYRGEGFDRRSTPPLIGVRQALDVNQITPENISSFDMTSIEKGSPLLKNIIAQMQELFEAQKNTHPDTSAAITDHISGLGAKLCLAPNYLYTLVNDYLSYARRYRYIISKLQQPNTPSEMVNTFLKEIDDIEVKIGGDASLLRTHMALIETEYQRYKSVLIEITKLNVGLLYQQAERIKDDRLSYGDRVNAGFMGLYRAAEKFDWGKGLRFSTYAVFWIKQSVQREIKSSGQLVKAPHNKGEENGENPAFIVPIDVGVNTDTPCVVASNNGSEEIYQDVFAGEIAELVAQSLDQIPRKCATVICLYYGINCKHPYSIGEIARILNITRETVKNRMAAGTRMLRINLQTSLTGTLDILPL